MKYKGRVKNSFIKKMGNDKLYLIMKILEKNHLRYTDLNRHKDLVHAYVWYQMKILKDNDLINKDKCNKFYLTEKGKKALNLIERLYKMEVK